MLLLIECVARCDSDQSDAKYWHNLATERILRYESKRTKINGNEEMAKNVIIFIGDGMGISTVTASRILKIQLPISKQIHDQKRHQKQHDLNNKNVNNLLKKLQQSEDGSLSFESFEMVSLVKTYILDSQVGDSGACATAIMSGVKANFETVGVNGKVKLNDCLATMDPTVRVSSVIDWAQQQGKSTGFVTTTRVTHATPAALYAHSASRYWESDDRMMSNHSDNNVKNSEFCKDIARQLIEDEPGKNLNVIMGGGRRNLLPKNNGGRRQDDRNLINVWLNDKKQRGLEAKFVSNIEMLREFDSDKVDYLLGIFADNHMAHEADRNDTIEPSLALMSLKAIEILKHNPQGFLLVIESGRIDHAHHLNNAYRALTDTLALDDAVEQVYQKVNKSNTLLLVTADHSHVFAFGGFPARGNPILGIDDQTSDSDKLPYTTLMYTNGPGYRKFRENLSEINTTDRDFIQQSAIPKRWETHGGEDVPLYVTGPRSEIFAGIMDQTFIPYGISYATCMGPMEPLFCKKDSNFPIHNQKSNHHYNDKHQSQSISIVDNNNDKQQSDGDINDEYDDDDVHENQRNQRNQRHQNQHRQQQQQTESLGHYHYHHEFVFSSTSSSTDKPMDNFSNNQSHIVVLDNVHSVDDDMKIVKTKLKAKQQQQQQYRPNLMTSSSSSSSSVLFYCLKLDDDDDDDHHHHQLGLRGNHHHDDDDEKHHGLAAF
uniref:alkaline phosphatase n=1 Tax=Dermatophagoides pteronyssinus TaxID=6956 RepID=A0A6P6XS21_DERPT|nr:alkaline phosphatase-like [Dermatophagoides pteronyssinus]